jgi:hypothetical protein
MYVDYQFYSGVYGGTAVASSDFFPLEIKASAYLDLITSDRAAAIITTGTDTATIQKIKLAVCAMIDEQYRIESSGGIIASESVGAHSVSYAVLQSQKASIMTKLTEAAKPFLISTGLLFRGFYADEYGTNSLSEISDL